MFEAENLVSGSDLSAFSEIVFASILCGDPLNRQKAFPVFLNPVGACKPF
jgi:hypothetical protein